MARTVVVYYHGTFVHRENGAHARVSELLRYLRASGRRTIVYSYYDHYSCPWGPAEIARFTSDFPGIELVLERRSAQFQRLCLLKRRLIALMPHLAGRLLAFNLRGATPNYDALMQRHPDAVLIVNYADGLIELNGLAGRQAIVETHDLKFVNTAKSLHRRLTAIRTMLSARAELELLDRANSLIAIAPPEAAIFRQFYPSKPVFMIPAYAMTPSIVRVEAFRYDLMFVGSDNVLNVDGLIGFVETHRAWLAERSLAVIGRVCSNERVRAAVADLPGVEMHGYVEDLEAFMAQCKLMIAPTDGTGLKIKVLEALSAGKPVFASASALAGLPPGYEACVFPIDEAAMQALLDDDDRREAAAQAAIVYCRDGLIGEELVRFDAHLETMGMGARNGSAPGPGSNAVTVTAKTRRADR